VSRVLVTGANGFVGRHLCRYLQDQGIPVRALLRALPESSDSVFWDESFTCDLESLKLPEGLMAGVDTVFHLAGIVHAFKPQAEMEQVYWAVNLKATTLLLEEAVKAGVKRFVYFSSIKAMADPGDQCVDESFMKMPEDVYGLSKRKAEEAVLQAGVSSGMHVCVLRPALVYGPGVKGNLLRMMRAIERGYFPPLADTGNKRSMVHVEDLIAAAFSAAVEPPANGKIYIVTDGIPYSSRQIYEVISGALGKKIPGWTVPAWLFLGAAGIGDAVKRVFRVSLPVTSETAQRLLGSACYHSDLIQKELGYRPRNNFFSAVEEMVKNYEL
jgi:nucleoside-diphosphate-sugar epimerase